MGPSKWLVPARPQGLSCRVHGRLACCHGGQAAVSCLLSWAEAAPSVQTRAHLHLASHLPIAPHLTLAPQLPIAQHLHLAPQLSIAQHLHLAPQLSIAQHLDLAPQLSIALHLTQAVLLGRSGAAEIWAAVRGLIVLFFVE